MTLSRRTVLKAVSSVVMLEAPAFAQAQNTAYPGGQPIRLVVPYSPGGGTDTVSRIIAEKVSATTGWTIVVDNKPGAGGNIGLDAVAKARPDGRTLGMSQTANLAINPALVPHMPFNAVRDFEPVIMVASLPLIVVVATDSPYRNLADLLGAAKSRPGSLRQALAGNGTVGHLAGELLCARAGAKVLNVPYKGASQALVDMIGGQSDFMVAAPAAVLELIAGKRLRALAVTSKRRLGILPDLPTVSESGYSDFEAEDWKALVVPAGTPFTVVRQLNASVQKVLDTSAAVEKLASEGSVPMGGSPEKAAKYIQAEQAKWATLIRNANIKLG